MGSMNVYDDGSQSWGGIGTGMASAITGAPAKAAAFTHTIEAIKDMRIARQRAQEQDDLTKAAVAGVDAATLPAAVAPRAYTAADISTPAVLDAPLSVTDRTSGIHGGADVPNGMFTDPRELAKAEADRAFAVAGQKAAIMKDPSHWAQQTAYGNVASGGVPTDPYERAKLDFLAGKGMPTNIGNDESKRPVKQWVPINEQNEPTGQAVASAIDPSRPGQRYALSSPISATALNPIESVPIAQNNFNKLADKIMRDAAAGKTPDEADLLNAIKLRDHGWQSEIKLERDENTKQLIPVTVPKTPPPTDGAAGYLFQVLKDREARLRGASGAPATATGAGAAGAGAAGAGAATPAPTPAPAVDASGVSVGAPLPIPGAAGPIVKRYMDQPVIDYIEKAKSGYSSVVSAMAQDNRAADIAIVNGASKVIDPPGVVRPTEAAAVEGTQGLRDQLAGLASSIAGGARLTKTGRYQIWNMINEKMKADMANAKAIREQHMVQLSNAGIPPEQAAQYLPALPTIAEVNPSIINSVRTPDFGDAPAAPAAPAAPTVPAAGASGRPRFNN